MTFREAVVTCFRKYADFKGRASRSEYWWFSLFQALLMGPAAGVTWVLFDHGHPGVGMVVWSAVFLPLWSPGWAVRVRRCHDVGRSGWTLKPFVTFEPGDPWPNKYGPPPGEEEPDGQPSPTSTPAVFAPCPGCGRTLNRQAGRCPYCQTTPSASSSRRDSPRPGVEWTDDEDTLVVPLTGVRPADAWQTIESVAQGRPESPVALDLYECPPGYDTEVGPLLDRLVGLGPPGVLREVLLLSVTPEVAQTAVTFSEQRGWHWERWESMVRVFVGKPD